MANKALCIGINNYPGTHMDLQGCVNDAEDWASVLSARAYKTTTLLDDKATKAAMVDAMSKLIGSAAKGDSLIITFSGHGTYQPDENGDEADGLDEALCPYDLQTGGNALTDDEIRALFATRKGGVRLLLISDSCHSGTVTRAAKAEKDADTRPRFMPMGNWLPASKMPKNFAGKPALTMLAPSGSSPLLGAYWPTVGRPPAGRLQGRAEQLQLRRKDQRSLQRGLYLLRPQDAQGTQARGHLRRMVQGHAQTPPIGQLSADPATGRHHRSTHAQGIELIRTFPRLAAKEKDDGTSDDTYTRHPGHPG
jgi:hypothetical protein